MILNFVANKVVVHFDVFGSFMKYWIVSIVYDTLIIEKKYKYVTDEELRSLTKDIEVIVRHNKCVLGLYTQVLKRIVIPLVVSYFSR